MSISISREYINSGMIEEMIELNEKNLLDAISYIMWAPQLINECEQSIKQIEEKEDEDKEETDEDVIEANKKNIKEIEAKVERQKKFCEVFQKRIKQLREIQDSEDDLILQ